MSFLFTIVCCIAVIAAADDEVVQFEVQDAAELNLFKWLMTHADKPASPGLKTYSYTNCGDPNKELLVLKNLTLSPDPLSFPGELSVEFNGQIKGNVDSPLKAIVDLKRKVASTWIKIPCIGNIGSCTYTDLCSMLESVTCPDPFVKAGIPCKCPFSKGMYSLPRTSFQVDAEVFPPGDYHATANLTYNSNSVACVELYASFE